jgi:hypothetical protein
MEPRWSASITCARRSSSASRSDRTLDHAGVAAFMELPDDVGPDVRRGRQHAEEVRAGTGRQPAKAMNRVHYSDGVAIHVSEQPGSGHLSTG